MKDIYDIKDIVLLFPINITYSFIFVAFIIILYFTYLFLYKNNNKKIETKKEIIIPKIKKDFHKILDGFEKYSLDLEIEIFSSKILGILREILEENGEENISKMTLEEINGLSIDSNLRDLIKQIYYKEYMLKSEDSNEIRINLISEIRKIIK